MVSCRLVSLVTSLGLLGAVAASQLPAQVFFYPPDPKLHHDAPAVSPNEAHLLLAHHLGFDIGETVGDMDGDWTKLIDTSKNAVGQGHQSSTLIVVQSDHPEDFIPSYVKPTFVIPNPPPAEAFTDLIHAYTEKAHHLFSDVFSSLEDTITSSSVYKGLLDLFDFASHAASMFVDELGRMLELVDNEESGESDQFSAYQVKGLAEVEKEHGRDSQEYTQAANSMEAFFSNPSLQSRQVAIIVVPPQNKASSHARRSSNSNANPLSGNSNKVVFSVSTCYADNSTCVESTSECSGHGSCNKVTKAGKSCYTCSCEVTQDKKGRKQYWAGQSCEKKDISTSFTLLAGTTIFLLLLIVFSISLLYSVGAETLPSTLTAAASAPHGMKRD